MSALPIQSTVDQLLSAGLTLSLTPERGLRVVPATSITPALRDLIRTSKAALVDYLRHVATNTDAANEAFPAQADRELLDEILKLAMRVCDSYGDSEQAREDMRQQVCETPSHLLPDLYEHFGGKRANPLQLQGATP